MEILHTSNHCYKDFEGFYNMIHLHAQFMSYQPRHSLISNTFVQSILMIRIIIDLTTDRLVNLRGRWPHPPPIHCVWKGYKTSQIGGLWNE